MLDPHLLRSKLDVVAKKLAYREFKLDVDTLRRKEQRRKILQVEKENLQAERNTQSRLIGVAKSRGENTQLLCHKVTQLVKRLKSIKIELDDLQRSIYNYALLLPNIPSDEVISKFENKVNQEILRWGIPRTYNFPVRDHVELGQIKRGLDFSAAIKLIGTRFVVIRDQFAQLHRALIQFMLDLHTKKHGYTEYNLPFIVNKASLYGTGQLPKFDNDLFHVQSINSTNKTSSYALIPTAEVPLTNLVRNSIIEADLLPLKMTANTSCFRSEAGSYGQDTRGLIRMHQFDKVELVQIVEPAQSMQALEQMTEDAEKVLQLLNLPYRKVLLHPRDIGFASCKTYDLEVWMPAQNNYREISSCSNMGDFQARRLQARYRSKLKNEKPKLVHTLNGSGLAVGRALIAVLENYQLADGRIEIPAVLQTYMNGLNYIN